MKKFKNSKRGFLGKDKMDEEETESSDTPDFASMAIGATAKKKKPKVEALEPKEKKKKMPGSAKKALMLSIKAKLKKKANTDESE